MSSPTTPIRRKFLAGPFQTQRALTVRILTNRDYGSPVGAAMVRAAQKVQHGA